MKLDIKKLYIVHKATPYSSEKDVFSGKPISIQEFAKKLKRGLDPNMVEGIYPSKRSAQLVANKLLKKISKSPLQGKVKQKKITKGFAVFSDAVMAKDKYAVTTPPSKVFPTKKEARAAIKKWEINAGKKSDFKIMTYDTSRR